MADDRGKALSSRALVFQYLFSKRGRPGWRLARALGLASPETFRRYERGQLTPSPETVEQTAEALDFPPEALDVLDFADGLLSSEPGEEPASPVALTAEERRQIHRACLATGWSVAEEVRFQLTREAREKKAAAARQEAEELWERMKGLEEKEQRDLVTVFPEFRSWALAELIAHASERAASHKVDKALRLAHLALFIAERVPGEEAWRFRLLGYVWAFIANARRVGNDFDGADEAFARAWQLWEAGAKSDSEILAEWRLFDLEASLRRAQERFSESLALLDRALKAANGHIMVEGKVLLKKSHVLEQMADFHGALAALMKATPGVEASEDPQLLFSLLFNTAANLCSLECFSEAAERLPKVREVAVEHANELSLIRVLWLEARVAAGQGRREAAVAALEQVQQDFTDHKLPYDAALSCLDLSVLWLQEGRTAPVRFLAGRLSWIFRSKGVHRKALAALALFCEAARKEAATVELARQVIREIEQARRLPLERALCR